MKILVTGSSGLIGTALMRALTAGGHDVVRAVRSGSPQHRGPTLEWDPERGEIDAAALEGTDAVVHLAGAGVGDKRWSDERKRIVRESRTRSTDLLARALAGLDRKPSVLLSGSAIGWYGDRGDTPLTEADGPGDDFLADVCREWEAATAPAEEAGIRTVRLRTGIVLSPDGGALAKLLLPFKAGLGGRMGNGRQWWSWISLDDEVAAIEWLLTADVAGPVNLTGPEPVTNADFTKALGSVLGRPTIVPVPGFGPKLLLGGELAEALLFTSARVVPEVLETAGYPFRHRTVTDALRGVLGRS